MRTSSGQFLILVCSALVAACSSGAPSPTSAASSSPEAEVPASPPTSVPPAASVDAPPSLAATATGFELDAIVQTVVDRVRVRSGPSVDASSAKLEPLLPNGTRLFVIAGPVAADGYDWYHVVPIHGGALPAGWVARAAREGEPWIASDPPQCPTSPVDVQTMLELSGYGGVACFGRREIQLVGEVECGIADVDYTVLGPDWLHDDRHCLIGSGETEVMGFNDGGIPGLVLPTSGPATVTGHFDDPQSTKCVYALDEPPEPDPAEIVAGCRSDFVATALELTP